MQDNKGNVGHYKSECPDLTEKKKQEIRAQREIIKRAALLAEESLEASLKWVNHDEDIFTEDEDNMGLMAMSDDDASVEEVPISNSNTSQYTFGHEQCEVIDTQEN